MGLRRKRRSGRLFEVAGDHGCAHEPKVTRDQAQQAGVPWSPRGWIWHMREAGREEDELAHRVIREGRTGGDSNNRAQLLETPPARESARHRPGIKGVLPGSDRESHRGLSKGRAHWLAMRRA